MHYDLKGIKEIDGEPTYAQIMPDGIIYPYTAFGMIGKNSDKKKLIQSLYDSIPECDTIFWRQRPYFLYALKRPYQEADKYIVDDNGMIEEPCGELRANIIRLYYRAAFVKDGMQVAMKSGIKSEGQPFNELL